MLVFLFVDKVIGICTHFSLWFVLYMQFPPLDKIHLDISLLGYIYCYVIYNILKDIANHDPRRHEITKTRDHEDTGSRRHRVTKKWNDHVMYRTLIRDVLYRTCSHTYPDCPRGYKANIDSTCASLPTGMRSTFDLVASWSAETEVDTIH